MVVSLGCEVVEVGRHVEQVGHERHFGDGDPEAPGEEVVDESSIAFDTGEGHPGKADAPSQLVKY